jgi:metal-responsive CopG/Arc/MetJ family transcriptional regulator
MASVRINVSVPRRTLDELKKAVEPRKRSRFISKAIEDALGEQKAQRLAAEYQEAAGEIRTANRDLEGTLSDGLD